MHSEIMFPPEAAEFLGRSVKTLANWRSTGQGPLYRKDPRGLIFYERVDLVDWMRGAGPKRRGTHHPVAEATA